MDKPITYDLFDDNTVEQSTVLIHDKLNPTIWTSDNLLKSDVLNKLIQIQNQFLKELKEYKIPIRVLDSWIVGSNASFNYTDKSDIDLHIIVDSSVSGVDSAILQILYDFFRNKFNRNYDISIYGINVELYIEDIKTNAISNGIYSLTKQSWIKFPKRIDVEIPKLDRNILNGWLQEYNNLLNGTSNSNATSFLNSLYMLRKSSLATDGEFGQGNLLFKYFRNNGFIDELRKRVTNDISKKLSLESVINILQNINEEIMKSTMTNTLLESIRKEDNYAMECYDKATGQLLTFKFEESSDGYCMFIKELCEKLTDDFDGYNHNINLYEFCKNNPHILNKFYPESDITLTESYVRLCDFINEGYSDKEGDRLYNILKLENVIVTPTTQGERVQYSQELMDKLTDLPEGSIIKITNSEDNSERCFRKVSNMASMWVRTDKGTEESDYTEELATDYKDGNYAIDVVQMEGVKVTRIQDFGTPICETMKSTLTESLNATDLKQVIDLASKLDIQYVKDLQRFYDEERQGDESVLDTLKRYNSETDNMKQVASDNIEESASKPTLTENVRAEKTDDQWIEEIEQLTNEQLQSTESLVISIVKYISEDDVKQFCIDNGYMDSLDVEEDTEEQYSDPRYWTNKLLDLASALNMWDTIWEDFLSYCSNDTLIDMCFDNEYLPIFPDNTDNEDEDEEFEEDLRKVRNGELNTDFINKKWGIDESNNLNKNAKNIIKENDMNISDSQILDYIKQEFPGIYSRAVKELSDSTADTSSETKPSTSSFKEKVIQKIIEYGEHLELDKDADEGIAISYDMFKSEFAYCTGREWEEAKDNLNDIDEFDLKYFWDSYLKDRV